MAERASSLPGGSSPPVAIAEGRHPAGAGRCVGGRHLSARARGVPAFGGIDGSSRDGSDDTGSGGWSTRARHLRGRSRRYGPHRAPASDTVDGIRHRCTDPAVSRRSAPNPRSSDHGTSTDRRGNSTENGRWQGGDRTPRTDVIGGPGRGGRPHPRTMPQRARGSVPRSPHGPRGGSPSRGRPRTQRGRWQLIKVRLHAPSGPRGRAPISGRAYGPRAGARL